ncbi:hypothetical protein [Serratia marcescens]|uniref:hypothetical protein n=1 Tax=Serratia marcescens TaxID=615 RepID=UPI00066EF5A1|nr:hypothetical protein [Serratia marcescens]
MDNKLSELSKPVAEIYAAPERDDVYRIAIKKLPAAELLPKGIYQLYSQDYVSALLAELEAKDKRIGELEVIATEYAGKFQKAQDANKHLIIMSNDDKKRIAELEAEITNIVDSHAETVAELRAKLATPVRLPDVLFVKVSGHAVPVMHADRVNERVRAAGLKIEGDE